MVRDIDPKLIEFDDADDDWMRSQKAYLQMLMALPEDERAYAEQQRRVADEEERLQWMIDCNKQDDKRIAQYGDYAKANVAHFEKTGDEKSLEIAELSVEIVKLSKQDRFTIGEIRKQRERVQWQKMKLAQMDKPPTEHEQS